MEPNEMHEFTEQMEKAGESALTHVSLGIAILAVLVAMVTVLSHRSHTEAVLMQARSSDIWNEYQAKKIRSESLTSIIDLLDLQPTANPAATAKKREEYVSHIEHWKDDLSEEQKQAHEFETEVILAERKAGRFDLGEALLQIAVVLSSITLLTRSRVYYAIGMVLGSIGLLCAASGLVLH